MDDKQIKEAFKAYVAGFASGKEHTSPSPKTIDMFHGVENKVAKLEQKVDDYCDKFDSFATNHFPTAIKELKDSIKENNNKIFWILGTIIIGFLATIVITIYR